MKNKMKIIISIPEINDMIIAKYSEEKNIPKGTLFVKTALDRERNALILEIEKIQEEDL